MKSNRKFRALRRVAHVGALALAVQSAHGATQNWSPSGSGLFGYNNPINWNGGAGPVPVSGDTANMQVDLTANQSVIVGAPSSVGTLLIGDAAQTGGVYQNHSFSGSEISFRNASNQPAPGTLTSIGGDNTISNNLVSTTTSSGGLTINVLSGTLTLAGNQTVPQRYTFAGPGTTILTGTNTFLFTGVTGGTLRAGAINALSPSAFLDISAGATVDLNNFNQNQIALGGAGSVSLGSATLNLRGVQQFTGGISGTGGITVQGGTGSVVGFANASNSYSGPNTIIGGNLQGNESSDFGDGSVTNKIIFAAGGTGSLWTMGGTFTTDREIILNGNGNISSACTFSGNISGAGGLALSGRPRLTGTNTYAGNTVITGGDFNGDGVTVASDASLGAASSEIVLGTNGGFGTDGANDFTTNRSFTNNDSHSFHGLRPNGRTMTFGGSGNNTWVGEMWISGGGTVAFNRTGGTTNVTPGAFIVAANGTLSLGGTADSLSDGVDHVDVRLSNGFPGALTVTQGTKNVGSITGAGTTTVTGGATLIGHLRGPDPIGTVQSGVNLVLSGGGKFIARAVTTYLSADAIPSITIDSTSQYDLERNGLIVNYTGSSPKAQIRQYILNGRGGTGAPTWNGVGGITSLLAQYFPENEAVGYVDNAERPGGALTTFMNRSGVDSTSILIARTIPGDADMDFSVDFDDLSITGSNYLAASIGEWFNGDFNYDGSVTTADAELLGRGFDRALTPPTHASLESQYGAAFADAFDAGYANPVPEPVAGSVLVLSAAAVLQRRRRENLTARHAA